MEVEVEFDYEAELGDELTIKTGDIIKEVKRMDGGWWEGSLGGRRGVFPDNFVKVRSTFVIADCPRGVRIVRIWLPETGRAVWDFKTIFKI